jgi:sigma-B regulation protein RsbU (phosphoserine phosphatase)
MSIRITESGLMKHLMDHIEDNIYFMDRKGRIILINRAGARWLGFDSPDEVIGKTDLDIFTNEHGRTAFEDEQRIMRTGDPLLGIEEKETGADGHETWVSTSKMPLRDESGEIVGVFGVSRDITEHKQAEIRAAAYAEENRQFREKFEDDLHMAAELQKTFFPTAYPVFPEGADAADSLVQFHHLHHAGGMVGGDYCSIRKLSDAEVGIFLCDMMGHGVRAALGTAIVRALVEDLSSRINDPGRFLLRLNELLLPMLRQENEFMYATACCMVLDVSTGRVRLAGAGHALPVRLHRGGSDRLAGQDHPIGPALAITADAEYRTSECVIQPGDAVFMYTDGIHEIEGPGREEYGEDRLLASARRHRDLALRDLFPALFEDARVFSDTGEFSDDVCLVGFRLRGHMAFDPP